MTKDKSCNFNQKQSLRGLIHKNYFEKFRKIYRKTLAPQSIFWKKLQGKDCSASAIPYEFRSIFQNTFQEASPTVF